MASWSLIPLLILTLAGEAAKSACPTLCRCNPGNTPVVDCSYANLPRIPWNLPDPAGLRSLDLHNNRIRAIIAVIVSYSNLEYLDLSNNEILTVDDYVFKNLPKLTHLYMRGNKLTVVTTATFSNLNSLIRLDLSSNHIEGLAADVFKDLSSLVELDLSSNRIETIPDGSFSGLTSLKNISLSSNRLYNLSSKWWSGCGNVDTILLDMNSITDIPDQSFHSVPRLRSLSMEGNGVDKIHQNAFFSLEDSGKGAEQQHQAPAIEKLSLKHNNLKEVPSNVLTELINLVTLDLSQNAMAVIDPDAFKNMNKLQHIYLNALPKLEAIRAYSFSELRSLQTLELSSNPELSVIETNAFLGTPNILEVDLHNNKLTTLDSSLLDWRKLEFLDLRNNPWNCDCKLGFLGEVLRDKKNDSISDKSLGYIYMDVKCSEPSNRKNIPVLVLSSDCISITVTDRNPDDPVKPYSDKIIIAVICMFAACFLACLFVLVWRTRKISFNKSETNVRQRRTRRLRRHRQSVIAKANGSIENNLNCNGNSDKISITENAMDQEQGDDMDREEDDNVFDDDAVSRCSETESQKVRKVSFSSYVTVRRCSSFEDV